MKLRRCKTLWITVGFPGSGKSTWAKSTGLPVVESDDYRYVNGVYIFDEEREPEVWKQHDRKYDAYLGLGASFILADCFLNRKIRSRYAIPALKRGFRVCVMWLVAPEDIYQAQQTHGVSAEVYQRMYAEFEVPDRSKEAVSAVYQKIRWS